MRTSSAASIRSMYRLVPSLVREMGAAYPELVPRAAAHHRDAEARRDALQEDARQRPEASRRSLRPASARARRSPGDVAFKLYDTFGFPLDLTEDALRARGITVDTKAFDAAMEKQKDEARRAWKGSGEAATEEIWFEIKEETGATEFLGYDTESAEGEIRALVQDGKPVKSLKTGDEGALILNQTPFYGESGGQVGDTGADQGRQGRAVPRHRHAEEAGRSVRAHRQGREGQLQGRRRRRA